MSFATMKNPDVVLSIILYSFCSGSLVLVNKLILHFLPYPSLVITIQLLFTVFFIKVSEFLGYIDVDPVEWRNVKPYLMYTVAFSLGVYCNMRSLSTSNVETVIVFRALAPLLVSITDALFLGRRWPCMRSWVALGLIAAGAYGYASTDTRIMNMGYAAYFWPTCYLLVISFEMTYGKRIVTSVDLNTRSGPVLYTNLLGWPPMLAFASMGGEYGKLYYSLYEHDAYRLPPAGVALLLLGCVIGTGIGYSSWWCRSNVSAASFTLIGVMNKCLTVLVNLLIWDQHANSYGIMALAFCLVGGVFYKQAPMRDEHPSAIEAYKVVPSEMTGEAVKERDMELGNEVSSSPVGSSAYCKEHEESVVALVHHRHPVVLSSEAANVIVPSPAMVGDSSTSKI